MSAGTLLVVPPLPETPGEAVAICQDFQGFPPHLPLSFRHLSTQRGEREREREVEEEEEAQGEGGKALSPKQGQQ